MKRFEISSCHAILSLNFSSPFDVPETNGLAYFSQVILTRIVSIFVFFSYENFSYDSNFDYNI